jgi:hypothetical protein
MADMHPELGQRIVFNENYNSDFGVILKRPLDSGRCAGLTGACSNKPVYRLSLLYCACTDKGDRHEEGRCTEQSEEEAAVCEVCAAWIRLMDWPSLRGLADLEEQR